MEETRILIQAALDIQKSKNEIDAQIKLISDKASKLEIGVTVDTKSAQQALKQEETMQNKLAKLESDRRKQAETDAKKQASAVNKALSEEYQNRQKLNTEIEKMQAKIDSLAKDMSRVNANPEMVNSVKALGAELDNVTNNADLSSINKQLDTLSNSFREAQQAAKQLEFDKNLEIDIQKAQVALKNLEQNLSAVGGNSELSQEFAKLSTEAENLTTKADLTNFNKQVQLFKTQLSGLSGEFKATQEAAKQLEFDKNLEIDIQKAQVALRALGQEWSAIGGNADLSQEFARLSAEAENLTSKADLDNFNKQVQLFQAQAKEAGVATKSWGAEIKATALDLAGMASATAVFMKAWDGIKQIISNVHELDTSMTEFNKVANLSASSTSKFLDEAAVTAKELSASITDVVDAQTEFKKLGFSTSDAQHLGKVAIMYNNVGDSVGGVDQATSSLISTMKAFNLGVSDAESIIDKFNEVANETSIDSGEIGSALQRSASALALAGEDLNSSIGLIVGGNEIVRDADKVGTALKTVSLRIRGAEADLESMGEETDKYTQATATMREEIMALSGVDIMIDDTTFKDISDILREISQEYENLTDVNQAALMEALFGKQHANTGGSLLQNFEEIDRAIDISRKSLGSADKEYANWQQSIDAALGKASATWQDFSRNFMNPAVIKGGIDAGTGILEMFIKLQESGAALPAVFAGVSTALQFKTSFGDVVKPITLVGTEADKTAGKVRVFGKTFGEIKGDVGQASGAFEKFTAIFKQPQAEMEKLSKMKFIPDVDAAQWFDNYAQELAKGESAALDFVNAHDTPEIIQSYFNTVDGGAKTFEGYRQHAQQAQQAVQTSEVTTKSATLATYGLQVAQLALNAAISLGIGLAIQFAVQGITKIINAENDAIEAGRAMAESWTDASETFQNTQKTINGLKDRYEALSKGVSSSGENISLTTEEFQEYSDIVAKIADIFPDMVDGYDSQGNAILDCKGNVEELTKALKEQEVAANAAILAGSQVVEEGFKANYDKYSKEYDTYSKILAATKDEDAKASYLKELETNNRTMRPELSGVLHDLGIDYSVFDSNEELFEKAAEHSQVIAAAVQRSKTDMESMNSSMLSIANASLSASKDFNNLDERAQSSIKSIVSSFDAGFLDKITDGDGSIATWIEENIIGNLEDVDFSNALSGISELSGDMLGSEYKDAVADIVEQMQKIDAFKDMSTEDILFTVGIENPQELDDFFDGLSKHDFSGIQKGFQDALTIKDQKVFKNLYESLDNALGDWKPNAEMNNMIADLFTGDNIEIKIENFEAFTKLAAQAGLSEEAVTALTYQLNNVGWENAGDTLANLEKFSVAVKSAGIESEEASKLFDSFAKSNVGGGISDLENQFNIGLISLEDFNDGVADLVQTWGQVEGLDEGKIESMTNSFAKSVPDIETMNEALGNGELLLSKYYNSFGTDQEFVAASLEAHIEKLEKLRESAQEAGDVDSFNRYTEQINAMTYALDSAKTSLGKFQQAMSQEDYDTDFNDYKEVFKALEEGYENGTTNSKKFVAAYKAMFGDMEVDIDFLGENLKGLGKLFGENVDLSDITEQLKKIKDYAVSDGDGGLKIEVPDLAEFAKDLNIGEEAALAVLQYLQMAGDIDFSNTKVSTPEGLQAILEVAALNGQTYNMEFYVGSENLNEIVDKLNTLKESEGSEVRYEIVVDSQGIETIQQVADDMEQLDGKTSTATAKVEVMGLQGLQESSNEIDQLDGKISTAKIETDAKSDSIKELDGLIEACIDTTEKLRDKLSSLSSVSVGDAGMDKLKDACQKVIDKLGEIIRMKLPDKSFSINANLSGIPGMASGGRAKGGITLVGEEGIELVKSGDKAYIVGQNGAEITTLKPGDQVYPYDETKRILKGRSGTHHEIPAYASGTIRDPILSSSSSSSSSKSSSKSSSSDSDAKKKLEKYLEAYKEAVKELQYYRDMDIYDEKEYYRQLTALANEYLRGKKDFLDEYRSYEVEFYKFRKDMLEEDRKETLKALDDQYKEDVSTTKDQYKDKAELQKESHKVAKEIEKDKYEDSKKAAKKEYDELKQITKRAHEDLKKEVKRAYEDEKEIVVKAYEAKKKAAKDAYEAEKKAAQDAYKAKKKAAEDAYKAEKKAAQDAFKAQKKAAKDAYDAQKKAAEDAHNAEKKALEAQKKAIKDTLSAFKELIDARKEALQREGTTHDYNNEVEEANREISQIKAELDALSLDNSAKANAKRIELEEKLREKLSTLEEKQYDRSVDLQIQALDDEYEREEKIAQEKMDLIDAQIDAIGDKYDEVKEILEAAYNSLVENMEASQDALMEKMEVDHDAHMESLEIAHNAHMESLELAYESEVAALEAGHEALIKSMERDHEDYVDQLDRDHEDLLNQMEEDHEATLDQLEEDYEKLLEAMEVANRIVLEQIENDQQEALDGLESALEENKNNINAKFDEILVKGLDTYTKLREEGMSALDALNQVASQINSMSSSGGSLSGGSASGFGFNYAKGGSSSEVSSTQQALASAGYSVGSTGADGVWGKNTEKGFTSAWQEYLNGLGANLKVDGIRGSATKEAEKKYGVTFPSYHDGGIVGDAVGSKDFKEIFDLKPDEMAAKLQVGEVVLTNQQQSNIAEAIKNPAISENLRTLLANSGKFFSMLFNNGIPNFQHDNAIQPAAVGSNASNFGISIKLENEIHLSKTDDDSMAKLDQWGKSIVDQAVKKVFETQVNQSLLGGGIPVISF